jgi:transglutaminase-like putative cysteine protease
LPTLTIKHSTTYRYRQPVAFGEHTMMLRPLESHDQSLIDAKLEITPRPALIRRTRDAFGNHLEIARFARRAKELRFESTVRLRQTYMDVHDFDIAEFARTCPFIYGSEEMPDLVHFVERQFVDPDCRVEQWTRKFLRKKGPTDTSHFLINLTNAINRTFQHITRHEKGVQTPLQTLELRSGSCRDLAMLMIEAVRSLGLAARFVSGYLHIPGNEEPHAGGGNTHAWAQIYLPGPGWVDFDPSNGIVGNRDLIRVAVVRDPRQAIPLHGTWTGFPSDYLGMKVEVAVKSEAAEAEIATPSGSPAGDAAINPRTKRRRWST